MREAAARVACQNHLKQLALGLHNYADTAPGSGLPAGVRGPDRLAPDDQLAWTTAVLPFLEQDALAKRFDPAQPWDAGPNADAGRQPVKLFQCPGFLAAKPDGTRSLTYPGVAGIGPNAATLPLDDPRAGAFGYTRRRLLADFPDGTSNTLLLAEATLDAGPWARGGPGSVRGLGPATVPYVGPGRPFGGNHFPNRGWFDHESRVPCTAAMADGTVRTIGPGVAADVFAGMATAGGGEPPATEW